MEPTEKDVRSSRLIFDARYARTLCHMGFVIKDVKPMRGKPDASIFIFDNTPEFQAALDEVIGQFKAKDDVKKAKRLGTEFEKTHMQLDD